MKNMKNIYACLLGEWVNLTTSHATIDDNKDANVWWEENGTTLFDYNYVNVQYRGKNYRIHPSFIQVVTE